MCDQRSSSVSDQRQSLCDRNDCELRKKGGVWICCLCDHGYKGADRNRYLNCAGCNHEVCADCVEWTQERAAKLLAANEGNEEDASDEDKEDNEQSERSQSSNDVTDESDESRAVVSDTD